MERRRGTEDKPDDEVKGEDEAEQEVAVVDASALVEPAVAARLGSETELEQEDFKTDWEEKLNETKAVQFVIYIGGENAREERFATATTADEALLPSAFAAATLHSDANAETAAHGVEDDWSAIGKSSSVVRSDDYECRSFHADVSTSDNNFKTCAKKKKILFGTRD